MFVHNTNADMISDLQAGGCQIWISAITNINLYNYRIFFIHVKNAKKKKNLKGLNIMLHADAPAALWHHNGS